MHDHGRVATPALSDPRPAPQLADAARPRILVQGHRAARPAPRARGTPPNQPEAPPGLGRPSPVRRADPTPTHQFARSPPDRPSHGPAMAPPPDEQEVDLPEPQRAPTPRRCDRRADRTNGQGEPELGLPAHPRRTTQTRPPRRRIHDRRQWPPSGPPLRLLGSPHPVHSRSACTGRSCSGPTRKCNNHCLAPCVPRPRSSERLPCGASAQQRAYGLRGW
jgi:hypothetical protein